MYSACECELMQFCALYKLINCNCILQEQILDYVFSHLGIDSLEGIDHPIALTEPMCNANYSRHSML